MHTRDGIWYVCEWTCAWEGASRRIPRRRCVQEGASNTSYHRHVGGVWYGCVRSQSVVRVPSATSLVARTACGVA